MNLLEWGMIGIVVGVISTGWHPKLSVRLLILNMSMGGIGAISGGVIGYLLYGSKFDGFDVSIFSISLILTVLALIVKKKVKHIPSPLPQVQIPGTITSLSITNS